MKSLVGEAVLVFFFGEASGNEAGAGLQIVSDVVMVAVVM